MKNRIVIKRTYSIKDDKKSDVVLYLAGRSMHGQEFWVNDIEESELYRDMMDSFSVGTFSGTDRYGKYEYFQEAVVFELVQTNP